MILNLIILAASLLVLIASGSFLVKGASSLALKIHISPLVVGLTIVAFGTSSPELFICINAALKGSPDIALGNAIGSNICNLTFILGTAAIINPILIKTRAIKTDWVTAMGTGFLLYFFSLDTTLQIYDGIIFLVILILYVYFIIKKSRKEVREAKEKAAKEIQRELDIPTDSTQPVWKDLFFILIGLTGLYFGSEWFVENAILLAEALGVSERVIGVSIVAVGTSMPELITCAIAAFRKETDLALGNLIGSNIFNILAILGLTSIVKNIQINPILLSFDMWWMLGITALILPLMLTHRLINRLEGAFLLGVFAFYLFLLF